MNILFYHDKPGVNSTLLTWTLAEELRLRGHRVAWGKPEAEDVPKGTFDWVRSGSSLSWPAVHLARAIGAKVHIHLEGVPYWRVGIEPAISWGYEKDLSSREIYEWRERYRSWMGAAYEADSCTVNGENQVKAIEDSLFGGKKLPNFHLLACGADARYALSLPDNWPREDYFVTASRLEPNKRVFEIAEAIAMLPEEIRLPWVVIGYGTHSQIDKLLRYCKFNNVKLQIRPCFGAEKWRLIKQAKLMLQGWSGVPPSEGLLCKTPVISFDHADILEMYGNSILWARDGDPESMATKIQDLLAQLRGVSELEVAYGAMALLDGRLYACTQEQAAERFERILEGRPAVDPDKVIQNNEPCAGWKPWRPRRNRYETKMTIG